MQIQLSHGLAHTQQASARALGSTRAPSLAAPARLGLRDGQATVPGLFDVLMRREDLPRRPVGVTNANLVLPCVAAGGVQLVERGEAR